MRIGLDEAKSLLNKAFREYKCDCIDKGLCEHQSNPFALEQAIENILKSYENGCDTCKFFPRHLPLQILNHNSSRRKRLL